MKNFLFRLLAYFICAFIMMIGYSMTKTTGDLPIDFDDTYLVYEWVSMHSLGFIVIGISLIYIFYDLLKIVRKFVFVKEK